MDPITSFAASPAILAGANPAGTLPAAPARGDVERFDVLLQRAPGTEAFPAAELALDTGVATQTMGEAIISGLQKMGQQYQAGWEQMQTHLDRFGDQPINIAGMMQVQVDLMMVTMQQDLTAKIADRTSQGLQTLFRNQ